MSSSAAIVSSLAVIVSLSGCGSNAGGDSPSPPPVGQVIQCESAPDLNFPQISYILAGYNIFEGNPLPTAKSNPGSDPGFKSNPLFVADYSSCLKTADEQHGRPKGVNAERDEGCQASFSSEALGTVDEFRSSMSSSMSIGASVEVPGEGGGSFGLSSSMQSMSKESTQKSSKMFKSMAECSVYKLALESGDLPVTATGFQNTVDKLSGNESFFHMFDNYGTHFVTSAKMGSRFGYTRYSQECSFTAGAEVSSQWSFSAAASMEAGANLAGKFELGGEEATEAEKALHNAFYDGQYVSLGAKLKFTQGSAAWDSNITGNPMPIRYDLTFICEHPALQEKKQDCTDALDKYCQYLQSSHPELECGKAPAPPPSNSCQWDLDCDDSGNRGSICQDNLCVTNPLSDATVVMKQPAEEEGGYSCRSVSKQVSDLMSKPGQCWDFDHLYCGDGSLPFKWGSDCYGGRISLPEGICAYAVHPQQASWDHMCDGTESRDEKVCGPIEDFSFWNYNVRVCGFKFVKANPCDHAGVLQNHTSTVSFV